MAKGSNFERQICKQLSLWWTDNKDDGVFWRTANSGGMATVRDRKGKSTNGAADITATTEEGFPFLKYFAPELKRGYSSENIQSFIDGNIKTCIYLKWIKQAKEAARKAKSKYWLIIHKRDRRKIIVMMPILAFHGLTDIGKFPYIKLVNKKWANSIVLMTFDVFLKYVSPEKIKSYNS